MSAGNSADKPQFVENQMLTHDSLNNLVEFSAGRTQRVMKALGLGGTVSGVSWRFDETNNTIIVEPGFIVFPDGEVAEITERQTFTAVDTDGNLAETGSVAIPSDTSHLKVSYKWDFKSTKNCFQKESQSQQMILMYAVLSHSSPPISDPDLPKPLSFQLGDVKQNDFYNKLKDAFNATISYFNTLVISLQTESFTFPQLENIKLEGNEKGMGVLGDIAFEIAYFSRRLVSACKCLSNIHRPTALAKDDLRRVWLNKSGNVTPPWLADSLRSEISLCHKVMTDSILDAIKKWNEGQYSEVSCRAKGVYARVGTDAVSDVFLLKTANILLSACDAIQTYSTEDFLSKETVSAWRNNVFAENTYSTDLPADTTPCSISSFACIRIGSKPILFESSNNRLFFLKLYREW